MKFALALFLSVTTGAAALGTAPEQQHLSEPVEPQAEVLLARLLQHHQVETELERTVSDKLPDKEFDALFLGQGKPCDLICACSSGALQGAEVCAIKRFSVWCT